MSRFWIVQEKHTDFPGGVNLEPLVIKRIGMSFGISTELVNLDEIYGKAKDGDFVFVQQEGPLNSDYGQWANTLLTQGISIIEKNVFALPSKFRPTHPKYYLALMSKDGAYRYRIRSFVTGTAVPKNYILLPNPSVLMEQNTDKRVWKVTNNEYSILRVGRPDPRKWTNFEIDFAKNLASQNKNINFELNLIGSPDNLDVSHRLTNLRINLIPYTRDLKPYYSEADLYLHSSAIGETFGNTIFEAFSYNLPIILALELEWDCAPIEYIGDYLCLGRKRDLIKDPMLAISAAYFGKLKRLQVQTRGEKDIYNPEVGRNAFKSILLHELESLKREMPSVIDALGHFGRLRVILNLPKFYLFIAILRDSARSFKRMYL